MKSIFLSKNAQLSPRATLKQILKFIYLLLHCWLARKAFTDLMKVLKDHTAVLNDLRKLLNTSGKIEFFTSKGFKPVLFILHSEPLYEIRFSSANELDTNLDRPARRSVRAGHQPTTHTL